MSLFLTKYNVEVGGKYTDGEVRVYRQYMSVLTQGNASANLLEGSANNTLSFTDSAAVSKWYGLSDTLNLTDNVTYVPLTLVDDTLGITDSFTAQWVHNVAIEDTLNLQQVAQKCVFADATDTIEFAELFDYQYILEDRKLVDDTLNFTQTLTSLSSLDASNQLAFTQNTEARNTTIRADVEQFFGIYDSTSTPYRMWVSDTLGIWDRGRIPITATVNQTLNLTDRGSMTNPYSELAFVQTVVCGKAKWVSQNIALTDSVSVTGIFMRPVSDDLGIGHAFTWYSDSPCVTKQYSPFEGETTVPDAVAAPEDSLVPPQVTGGDRFLLYYPARGTRSSTVVLRAPELDNRDRNAYTRVTRETRGGTVKMYADPTWPKMRTMIVTIIGLLKTEIDSLQTFLYSTLGQEIGITDWEGRQWAGVITNPEEPATQDGKDRWTVILEFDGEVLVGQFPGADGNALTFTDTVGYVIV